VITAATRPVTSLVVRVLAGAALVVGALLASATSTSATTSDAALATLQTEILAALSMTQLPATTTPALTVLLPKSAFSIPFLLDHCTPSTNATTEPLCSFGDKTASTTVVLYGNSEAQSWAPAFNALGLADGFRLVVVAKPACGSLLDSRYLDPKERVEPTCYRFDEWAAAKIAAIDPALLVIATTPGNLLKPGAALAHFHYGERVPNADVIETPPGRTATDLDRFVGAVAVPTSRIVIFGAIPTAYASTVKSPTPDVCLLAHESDIGACTMIAPTAANNRWEAALATAATRDGTTLLDPSALTCVGGKCPLVVDDTLVHFNELHLSGPYLTLIAPALGELLINNLP
jgi:hypothetical protein